MGSAFRIIWRTAAMTAAVVTTSIVGTLGLSVATSEIASASVVWGTPTGVPGSLGGYGIFRGVSCVGTGTCTAVGNDANFLPIAATETGGVWGTVSEIPGSPGASGTFYGVSCTGAGNCMAVGSDGHAQPMYASETGGVWGAITEVPSSAGSATFYAVTCTGTGECIAVGYDQPFSGNAQPIYASETEGAWGAVTEVPSSLAGGAAFYGLSCTGVGNCTAVGADGGYQPITATETGGAWGTPVEVPGSGGGTGYFKGVSCTGTGECVAVGRDKTQSIIATESGGVWGTVNEVPGAGGAGYFYAVSCTGLGFCTAVGLDGNNLPTYATESGGTWGSPTEVTGDGGAAFYGVSCTAAVSCTAVGQDNTQPIYSSSMLGSPTITSFSPHSGPVGTVVTIHGANLDGATKVTFNGVKGTITSDSATKIKVKVPAGATTGKIKVVASGGTVKTATAFAVS